MRTYKNCPTTTNALAFTADPADDARRSPLFHHRGFHATNFAGHHASRRIIRSRRHWQRIWGRYCRKPLRTRRAQGMRAGTRPGVSPGRISQHRNEGLGGISSRRTDSPYWFAHRALRIPCRQRDLRSQRMRPRGHVAHQCQRFITRGQTCLRGFALARRIAQGPRPWRGGRLFPCRSHARTTNLSDKPTGAQESIAFTRLRRAPPRKMPFDPDQRHLRKVRIGRQPRRRRAKTV